MVIANYLSLKYNEKKNPACIFKSNVSYRYHTINFLTHYNERERTISCAALKSHATLFTDHKRGRVLFSGPIHQLAQKMHLQKYFL